FVPLFKKRFYRMRGEQARKTGLFAEKMNQHGANLLIVFDNAQTYHGVKVVIAPISNYPPFGECVCVFVAATCYCVSRQRGLRWRQQVDTTVGGIQGITSTSRNTPPSTVYENAPPIFAARCCMLCMPCPPCWS